MGIVITILFIVLKVFSRKVKEKKGCALSLYKGIPMILVLLAIIVALYSYYTSKTVPGRYYYAISAGASAYSGIETVLGVVIGAIFMNVFNNGMSIMGIDANWQKAAKGLVLLAAVVFDVMSKKKDG